LAFAQKPIATLPTATVDTTYSLPVGGTNCHATNSSQFSACLISANPGDIITLDAGTVYIGNFAVPSNSNPSHKWIYIQSSNYSSLPAPGTRVSPADAVNMPKIVTPNVSQALSFKTGSNYIRTVGVEIYSASTYQPSGYTPGVNFGYYLVGMNGPFPWTLPIADEIIFDRCYVHGDATHDVQAGIQSNFSNYALVDSYLSELHAKGVEVVGTGGFYTPGPQVINNNYIEAAGENIFFGGSGGNTNPWVPADITITNNYIFKPLAWVPLSLNGTYVMKNSLELKSAKRVLVDHNVIENKWAAGQVTGAVMVEMATSQSGDIAVLHDITISNNTLKNVISGFTVQALDYYCGTPSYPNCHNPGDVARVNYINNLVTLWDTTTQGGNGHTDLIAFVPGANNTVSPPVAGLPHDLLAQHNTVVPFGAQNCFGGAYFSVSTQAPTNHPPPFSPSVDYNIWLLDNVLCKQTTGDFQLTGTTGLNSYMLDPSTPPYDLPARYFGNVMNSQGGTTYAWPPNNIVRNGIGYVNAPIDYTLNPGYLGTSDGTNAGVNMSQLNNNFPIVTTTTLPNGQVGTVYSASLAAIQGTPPYSWAVSAGTMCTGLTLNSNGTITGTPTSGQVCNFSVIATDSKGFNSVPKNLSITVTGVVPPGLAITNVNFPGATIGANYNQKINITGGTPPYTNVAVISGSLPPGITVQNISGSWYLAGVPNTAGSSTFTLQVTDSVSVTAAGGPYTITIVNAGTTTVSGAILWGLL
jgi:hypothetical protein